MRNCVDGAALLNPFNEGVSGSVIGDCEAERVFGLNDLHLLRTGLFVGEDEVVQTDLTSEQLVHVDFVRVKRAE